MNEFRNDATLTTADIAHPQIAMEDQQLTRNGRDFSREQGRDFSREQMVPPASRQAAETSAAPLFPDSELQNFRGQWDQVQTSFVDEPRTAVEQADSLVANVVKRIAEQFSAERAQLETQWDRGDNVSTEDLRQALRRYRSFFDRLLTF